MTSFNTLETSQESSRPLEVYAFALGSEDFRYAASEDDLTVGSVEYPAAAIARNNITQGADERRRSLVITVPGTNEFARRYIGIVPSQVATLSIIRLQRDESPTFNTQILVFKGKVNSVRFPDNGETAEIAVRSLEAAASRQIPRWTYMGLCNHVLYDATSGCNADANNGNFKFTGPISAVSGNVITVPGVNAHPDGWWNGGFVKLGSSDFRLVLSHTGNNLFLLLPFGGASVVGATVTVQAGCDHILTEDCSQKFDRAVDFGGFAFVPLRNPFAVPIA